MQAKAQSDKTQRFVAPKLQAHYRWDYVHPRLRPKQPGQRQASQEHPTRWHPLTTVIYLSREGTALELPPTCGILKVEDF